MKYTIGEHFDGCYEGTSVLINKLGIRDDRELEELESVITTMKITQLIEEGYDGSFTADHYCDINRFIMGDIYNWAGTVRTVPLAKKGTSFHSPENLGRDLGRLFDYLNSQNCFFGLSHDEFAENTADFYSDLNLLHPFREGNGRSQRVLITQLVSRAGHSIDFSRCDKDLLMIATISAAQGVNDYLRQFFLSEIK